MKKNVLLAFCISMFLSFPALAQGNEADLYAFSKKIIEVFSSGDKEAYMDILHPQCPAPNPDRLAWQLSSRWQKDRVDSRIKKLAEAYDREQLDFIVEPQYALEFQVWILRSDGREIELVTGYPIALHDGEMKILDYPCFEPKK